MHVVQALVRLDIGGSQLVAIELGEFLTAKGHKVTFIAADGPLGDRARASGAGHLDWPIGKKRIATLRYIKRLGEWFAEDQPDIVHVHARWPAWICWWALQRVDAQIRPAFLTTMHGHYTVSAYSSVMARGSRTIVVSGHIRNYTLKNYPAVNPDHIITIHGGASREDFPHGFKPPGGWREKVEEEFPALKGKRWLLLPGRVSRWKGHADFLRLIAALKPDYPDLQGVIVGGGKAGSNYQAELTTLATKLGISRQTTFSGDRLDIRNWMAASELVFNLSNKPPEAFGRTVLETLCLGKPMIIWNHGGAAEIMARMFPVGGVTPLDSDELESRTRQFLESPPQVAKSDAYTLEESMNKHLAVYQDILRSRVG